MVDCLGLQERGQRCLTLDLEQQVNITQSFLPHQYEPTGVETHFASDANHEPRDLAPRTTHDAIDVIPVTGQIARCDLAQPEQRGLKRLHTVLADTRTGLLPDYGRIPAALPAPYFSSALCGGLRIRLHASPAGGC